MRVFFLCLICLITNFSVAGQKYFGIRDEQFGKNKVQRKTFEWKTIKTNNFEFNFYKGGEELARKAALKAETDYPKITEILGYTPFSVMKIFIYNTDDDLKQSNIGSDVNSETDQKNINLSKARIQIAYNKNDSLFHQKLIKEVSTLFVFDMLYGGSLKESMQSQFLLTLPDWFINGIASYISSYSVSIDKEAVNNLISKNPNKKLSHYKDQESTIIGHSIWYFVAAKYGKDNISNILNLTRIIRNEQSSFTSTLGLSFNKFLKEWKNYYQGIKESNIDNKVGITTSAPVEVNPKKSILDLKPGEIDTDNYSFDLENIATFNISKRLSEQSDSKTDILGQTSSVLQRQNSKREIKIGPVKAYNNQLVSTSNQGYVVLDPVRRFGIGYSAGFNDLLENNVLKIDAFIKPTSPFFRNYDYKISYAYYPKKFDFKVNYERRSINIDGIDESNDYLFRPLNIYPFDGKPILIQRRIFSQNINAQIIYPIRDNLKLEFSPSFFKAVDIEYELPGRDNLTDNYLIPALSLVYDNSNNFNGKIDYGTKAKLTAERSLNFKDDRKNFDRINLDVRHTQKLIKGVLIEGRINYTKSSGNAPKFSILGGVENWVNRSIHEPTGLLPGKEGDFRDILFYNFPGQLRGFQAARLFGHSHILANAEMRFLMADYFPSSTLTSNFLRNLQLVGFYDLGTAWKGSKGPFSKKNSLNTIVLGNDGISPFFAEVTNFKSPFLQGLGVGVRTNIFGYLIKIDYAVGREDKAYNKPLLYISLGRDF